jgi:hypothetical protein
MISKLSEKDIRMFKAIKVFEQENRKATINLTDEIFEVIFLENGKIVGTIEYTDKSYHYVSDAAENWVTGIMTKETVKRYQNLAA